MSHNDDASMRLIKRCAISILCLAILIVVTNAQGSHTTTGTFGGRKNWIVFLGPFSTSFALLSVLTVEISFS